MDKNQRLLALYEISMSIGNTLELKKMLNESVSMMLSRLNCSSAAIYKSSGDQAELLYAKPKVLIRNRAYLSAVNVLDKKFYSASYPLLVDVFGEKYFYLFELKNFGYFILTKSGGPLDDSVVDSLPKLNLKLLNAIFACLDNAKQHQLEQQIRKESTLLKSILNTVPVRIFWKDITSRYLGCNNLFAQDASLRDERELIGKSDYDMPWKREADLYRADDKMVMETGTAKLDFEEPKTLEKGSTVWVSISKVPLKNEDGKIFGVLGAYLDITAKKESEKKSQLYSAELRYQAYHDALTGLPNRLLFLDRLSQSINQAQRAGSKVAVLFIDLDRFKGINDSLGHNFGDEVIKEVAGRMMLQVRKTDTVARFGGDEFVMILDNISDAIMVVDIAQKIMQAMRVPIVIESYSIYVTLSIGISIYPNDGAIADTLLKNADAAMYKAKEGGRNTYQFYTEDMTERAFERMLMETNLREGIDREEFLLYYQPQVNGEDGVIIGMEALIRWKHKSMGLVSPAKFIPIAEETGLIIPLGKWIMKTGMCQMVKWVEAGMKPGTLALNLSLKQLQEDDFLPRLQSMLMETGCKPQWLEFEVTEGQIMHNPEQTILLLEQISALGIEIAIDDFGTGYSSLSYLKRLPIDKLKIDQSFVRDIPGNEEDVGITKAVIALSKSLNMSVIAEGVETEEQKNFLVENGCKNIQGYFYSRPMPSAEMTEMLRV